MLMRTLAPIFLYFIICLSGCTTIQRAAHMYTDEAPNAHRFQYRDGGSSIYYTFTVGDTARMDTVVFFYGGTGCPSWKSVMPDYVAGLKADAQVFVLNKRFVSDRSTGMFDCGREFHLANNPDQWVRDYSEFIAAQLHSRAVKPRNVVLVGVSEGAWPAARVAAMNTSITHLAIIGSGGYSMRKSLDTLARRRAIRFDVESGWGKISADPRTIEKTWYGQPYRWWSDIMDIDPMPDFLKLDIPVLLGIGEKDESVPVESARFLEARFLEEGKRNLLLHVYPDADHRLSGNGISYRQDLFKELSGFLQ